MSPTTKTTSRPRAKAAAKKKPTKATPTNRRTMPMHRAIRGATKPPAKPKRERLALRAPEPTPAKKERHDDDFYRTPAWVTSALLRKWAPRLKIAPARIMEPCAGDGAIVDQVRECWPDAAIDAFDMAPRRADIAQIAMHGHSLGGDYDLVITNPPFDHALEIVQSALAQARPGGHVAMFLRQGFMASKQRGPWLRANVPERVFFMSARPSFDGDGTDLYDYAWYIWRRGRRGRSFIGEWLDV